MSEEEKMLYMFELVHGKMTKSCSAAIIKDGDDKPMGVACVKDGDVCWSRSREDLVFEYATRSLD